MSTKPKVDVLFLIRARLDSGRDKGAPQLNKDIRALKSAEAEIVALRKEIKKLEVMASQSMMMDGLRATAMNLLAILNYQIALLEEVENVCGRDGYGCELEDGESTLIDKIRAHLATLATPKGGA